MRKLIVFSSMSLDGYFSGKDGDLTWAENPVKDGEWDAFVAGNANSGGSSGGLLVLGRITYQMMANYWPTPAALQNNPAVAEGINKMQKVVFSRTLDHASWQNSRLVKEGLVDEIRRLKNESGSDMVILGSGTIVSQLAQEHLVDEYQVVVVPVVLGTGKTMFGGVQDRLNLKLTGTRSFRNGNVVLTYRPVVGRKEW